MTQSAMSEAAGRYLARGWTVLPLRSREKRPLIAWEPLQHARPSAADVADWFARWPNANIGVVTGEASHLVVVDVDPRHGGDDSLKRLEKQFGSLPPTVEATTGGGGRHLYFAHPGGLVRNRAGLAPGLDLRGDGGYIVAPPSVHPNGRPYAWVVGCSPDEARLVSPPRWILCASGAAHASRTLSDWRRFVHDGVPEGERNSTLASLTGHLLWRGVDPDVALELLLAWNRLRCRPPLEDAEVAQVVANIVRLHSEEGERFSPGEVTRFVREPEAGGKTDEKD